MDAGKSNDEVNAAVKLIALYVGNAAKNPQESKFLRIRAGNKAFAGKISSLEGAVAVLEACKFMPQQQAPAEGKPEELFYVISSEEVGALGAAEGALTAAISAAQTVAADTLGQLVTTAAEADAAIEEVWRLGCQLEGHTQDVRGVAASEEGCLLTASRDKTVKVWALSKDSSQYTLHKDLQGHEYHVASCAAVAATARDEELFLSGSYDLTTAGQVSIPPVVNVWSPSGQLKKSLGGHKGTVSFLASSPEGDKLYSASWDKTIRVWDRSTLEHQFELKGHSQAVWALLPLRQGKLLSASADRSIKLWDQEECVGTLSGHTDCVRALALLPDGRFVSAGNDNTIKIWSLDLAGNSLEQTCGFCLATLVGHTNFVYALAVLPSGDIVSGGEDRTVRVWRDNKCVSIIRHPDTVWSVTALPNGDIATGCADGKARVFTQSEERQAGEEAMKEWEKLLANSTIASHTMGSQLQLDRLPGPEALEAPGATDGQTRVIRQGSKAFAFAWSAAASKWEPVGEVVDSAGDSKNTVGGGKMTLDGKEYDFVFDIEVEEGRMEKLGINKKDNPYMIASDFIDKHDLNPDYMETIVGWLDEEMGKLDPEKQASESDLSMLDKDPYNEGKVYRAGSAQNLQQQETDYYDPLTGKKLGGKAGDDSDSDDEKPAKPARPTVHVPSSSTSAFPGAPKAAAVLKKVGELNEGLEANLKMTPDQLHLFTGLVEGLEKGEAPKAEALELIQDKLIGWPAAAVFPILDVVRALMARPDVAEAWATKAMGAYSMAYAQEGGATAERVQEAQKQDMVLKVLMAASCAGPDKPPMPTVLMGQRAVCNAFMHPKMKSILQLHIGTAAAVFATTGVEGNKLAATAHATLLLNYAVLFKGLPIDDKIVESMLKSGMALLKAMGDDADTLMMYRVVAAVGTLIAEVRSRVLLAQELRVEALVRDRVLQSDKVRGGMGEAGDPRVTHCCYQALAQFDAVRLMAAGVKKPETEEEFDTILRLAQDAPVLVDFYADWCGPCKVIAPAFEAMAAENPGAVLVKVNVDELKGVSQRYKVEAMPTFKFLKRGKEVHTIQGANEAALRQALAKFTAAVPAPAAAQ